MVLPLIGLIPLLPLAGFLVCGLFGKRVPKSVVSLVACGSVFLAFLVAVAAVIELGSLPGEESRGIARGEGERAAGAHDRAEGTSARGGEAHDHAGGASDGAGEAHEAARGVGGAGESGTHGTLRSFSIDYWTWIPPIPFEGASPRPAPGLARPLGPSDSRVGVSPAAFLQDSDPLKDRLHLIDDAHAHLRSAPENRAVLEVSFGFRLDPLSSVMVLIVTGVGFLIHLYSTGYMARDPGYARYFAYLNLFMAMMLTLVLASNFLVMFVGWEGVGLCSYLLIGFWYEDAQKAQAGRKAFITNRIGDFAFILGLLAILALFRTLDIRAVMTAIEAGGAPGAALTVIALALFVGACGKSAQIPLYVWLPDAMAGPTPVSALIHAATMVTAGVYMVARCASLFAHAPGALLVVGVFGAATALFAATIALAQSDIKKVLAYSTVSQLGYMFMALGVGAFSAAIFHLMTHAFFKALLFLGAGSVIHAMSGEQNLWTMGGLAKKLPWTFRTMVAGALAIAGIPILSGFFSKDEILWGAWRAGQPVIWAVGAVAAALTAFYMFRMIVLAFGGRFRGTAEQEHHLHESPPSMVVPLVVLAVLSIAGGWIGIPHSLGGALGIPNAFEEYLGPVFAHANAVAAARGSFGLGHEGAGTAPAAEYLLMLLAVGIAVGGILLARWIYAAPGDRPSRIARSVGPLYGLVARAYRVDDLYDATVLRLYRAGTEASASFDRWAVDGIVNAVAAFTELLGQVLRLFQTGFVRNYALWVFLGAIALVWMIGRG